MVNIYALVKGKTTIKLTFFQGWDSEGVYQKSELAGQTSQIECKMLAFSPDFS